MECKHYAGMQVFKQYQVEMFNCRKHISLETVWVISTEMFPDARLRQYLFLCYAEYFLDNTL